MLTQGKATLPFVVAVGAKAADIDEQIGLVGEAVYPMKDEIARTVHGVGFPPLPEILEQIYAAGIPIYV